MAKSISIDELVFDEKGLIPTVVVDASTGKVLTLAFMNKESLKISVDEGRTCFWSRSRGELWRKGETSGNVQHIVNIMTDCDRDALTVTVKKEGPACHTGAESCFFNEVHVAYAGDTSDNGDAGVTDDTSDNGDAGVTDDTNDKGDAGVTDDTSDKNEGAASVPPKKETQCDDDFSIDGLYSLIMDRRENRKEGSYTAYLFDKGVDKILKKIGEESAEVIIAGKSGVRDDTVYEIADLVYHTMVLMAEAAISPEDIRMELKARYVAGQKEKNHK
ncbi:MAG: bifunctional phosphoribosyl-AMP cyclohydrolase/phosphoribosyl-ATP diphosphatase HisIE [Oscillospiraceae bacterium]|nr:bifunctional phosphoribosyl-AMP cyclohydrolase/phosphoribosyl-ATP diphosphatase HisIE [Oscillospiraceae bacterium]